MGFDFRFEEVERVSVLDNWWQRVLALESRVFSHSGAVVGNQLSEVAGGGGSEGVGVVM